MWAKLIAAAVEPERRLRAALANPRAAQTRWLLDLLARNAATAFGRAHGFSAIDSIYAYRAAVPVQTHDDLAPAIRDIADLGVNALTEEPVIAFERTGGTASGGKLVPYTARSLRAFGDAVLPWLGDLVRRHPRVATGKAYVAISPATRKPEVTRGGVPVGLASDAAYLGTDLEADFAAILAVDPRTGLIDDIEEWRLSTLTQLVECEDLSFVSVWSPTFLLGLLDELPKLASAIAARLSPAAEARLGRALHDGHVDTTRLWPNLAVVSCWTEAASAPFARRLASRVPHASVEPKGLLATEAAMTVPLGAGPGCVPALTSAFLEFRAPNGLIHLAGELAVGETCDVMVTTEGGLYRYAIGDRVTCVAKRDGIERLVFAGRVGAVSDLVGEKLEEAFVAAVLTRLKVAARVEAAVEPAPHYRLRVDGEAPPGLAEAVDAALAANPQYAYARRMGQLGPVIVLAEPGLFAREAEARAAEGQRLSDNKPRVLAPALRAGGVSR